MALGWEQKGREYGEARVEETEQDGGGQGVLKG